MASLFCVTSADHLRSFDLFVVTARSHSLMMLDRPNGFQTLPTSAETAVSPTVEFSSDRDWLAFQAFNRKTFTPRGPLQSAHQHGNEDDDEHQS